MLRTRRGGVAARPMSPQHPITGQDPAAATEQFGRPGPWNARLPHFRLEFTPSSGDEQQSEFLVPHAHGADAIRAVLDLELAGVVQVAEFRTIAADDLWLSPFHDRASVGLHFTWIDDDAAVRTAVAAVEQALAPFDPRPHWGKVFLAEPSAVRAHYPRLVDFQALAAHARSQPQVRQRLPRALRLLSDEQRHRTRQDRHRRRQRAEVLTVGVGVDAGRLELQRGSCAAPALLGFGYGCRDRRSACDAGPTAGVAASMTVTSKTPSDGSADGQMRMPPP